MGFLEHFCTRCALVDSPLALCTQNTHITDSQFPSCAPLPPVFLYFTSISSMIFCLLCPSTNTSFHFETVVQEMQASPESTVQLVTALES